MIQIIDASVAVKWFWPEDPASTAAAAGILEDVKNNPRLFAVPELFYSECLHVLARKLGNIKDATWAVEQLFRLGIQPLHFDATVAVRAARAMQHGLSGYDATYYAFAESVNGRWLTFDSRAAAKAPRPGLVSVR